MSESFPRLDESTPERRSPPKDSTDGSNPIWDAVFDEMLLDDMSPEARKAMEFMKSAGSGEPWSDEMSFAFTTFPPHEECSQCGSKSFKFDRLGIARSCAIWKCTQCAKLARVDE